MKKTYKFLSAVAVTAALCTSCSTDDITAQQQTETTETSLTATLGETSTRAGINASSGNTHTLYWHNNDQILVRTKGTDGTYSQAKFDIAQGTATGVTSATFQGRVSMKTQIDTYAVYPYNENHEFTGEKSLTFNLPSEYNYETVESGIFPKDGAYRTTHTNVPMIGTIADGTAKFKHLGGLLVIRIDKMPSESGKIFVNADQRLTGNFTVEDLSASDVQISTDVAADQDDGNEVIFTYSNATKGGVGVFYLPVPTGSYTNLQVGMSNGVGNYLTADYGSLKVDRADIIAIPVYQDSDGTYYSCTYEVNGHKFIDLCLPSGLLWAETNIGAETAADDGNYYAWGETEPQSSNSYAWNSYTFSSPYTKYNSTDKKTTLDKEDDAAYINWGSFCRMPTYGDFTGLTENCIWTWETQTNSDGQSIHGYTVKSKKNDNSIFLPASGYRYSDKLYDHDSKGWYWSSTLEFTPDYVYELYFYGESGGYYGISYPKDRYCGLPIRPVAKTYSTMSSSGSSVADMSTSGFDSTWE